MSGLDYVREEEVTAIPVMQREVEHVIYGPLADFPLEPAVVLLFAHAQQGLILGERPGESIKACRRRSAARLRGGPQVIDHGHAAMSLGCCGARAYLDALSDSVAMSAFPGSKLGRYCDNHHPRARQSSLTAFTRAGARSESASGLPSGDLSNGFRLDASVRGLKFNVEGQNELKCEPGTFEPELPSVVFLLQSRRRSGYRATADQPPRVC